MYTRNRVHKHKGVVSKLHVCTNDIVKMYSSYIYLTFLQEFKLPHIRNYLIFFRKIGVAMSNIHFSALDNIKWLAKHISTKVSFKFPIRKRLVYIDICWSWIWNQYFYLGIWNDRTKIIVLPSFHLVTRINSQNRNETGFFNVLWRIICIWILVFPIGIIEVSTPRIWSFLLYFNSLKDFWPRSTWDSLVHTWWGEM